MEISYGEIVVREDNRSAAVGQAVTALTATRLWQSWLGLVKARLANIEGSEQVFNPILHKEVAPKLVLGGASLGWSVRMKWLLSQWPPDSC